MPSDDGKNDQVGLFLRAMVSREPGKRKVKPSKSALIDLAELDLGESSDDSDFHVDESKLNDDDDVSINSDPDAPDDDEDESSSSGEEEDDGEEGVGKAERDINGSMKLADMLDKAKELKSSSSKPLTPKIMICSVCLGDCSDDTNEIVSCDGCHVDVHEGCYGISDVISESSTVSSCSTEPWFCDACKAGVRDPPCELCPNLGYSIFKETEMGRWVHLVCALYVPGVAFSDVDRLSFPTLFECAYSRWGAKTCLLCEDMRYSKTGMCIGCDAGMCKANFHVTCAQREGLLSEVNPGEADQADPYYAHCKMHTDKEQIRKRKRNFLTLQVNMREGREKQQTLDSKTEERLERKKSIYRDKYMALKASRPTPWYPTQKLPKPLTTCASLFRSLLHKTQVMGISTESTHLDDDAITGDVRKKWHIAPSFNTEFVSYYLDRIKRMEEMKQKLKSFLVEHDELTEEETKLRNRYGELDDKNRKAQDETTELLSVCLELHDMLKFFAGRPLKLSPIVAALHNPPPLDEVSPTGRVGSGAKEKRMITKAAAKMIGEGTSTAPTVSSASKSDAAVTSPSNGPVSHASGLSLEACNVCKSTLDQHLLIQCDTCSYFYHLSCLDPPLTRMPKKTKLIGWQCSDCCKSSDSEQAMEVDTLAPRKLRRLVKEPAKFSPSQNKSQKDGEATTTPSTTPSKPKPTPKASEPAKVEEKIMASVEIEPLPANLSSSESSKGAKRKLELEEKPQNPKKIKKRRARKVRGWEQKKKKTKKVVAISLAKIDEKTEKKLLEEKGNIETETKAGEDADVKKTKQNVADVSKTAVKTPNQRGRRRSSLLDVKSEEKSEGNNQTNEKSAAGKDKEDNTAKKKVLRRVSLEKNKDVDGSPKKEIEKSVSDKVATKEEVQDLKEERDTSESPAINAIAKSPRGRPRKIPRSPPMVPPEEGTTPSENDKKRLKVEKDVDQSGLKEETVDKAGPSTDKDKPVGRGRKLSTNSEKGRPKLRRSRSISGSSSKDVAVPKVEDGVTEDSPTPTQSCKAEAPKKSDAEEKSKLASDSSKSTSLSKPDVPDSRAKVTKTPKRDSVAADKDETDAQTTLPTRSLRLSRDSPQKTEISEIFEPKKLNLTKARGKVKSEDKEVKPGIPLTEKEPPKTPRGRGKATKQKETSAIGSIVTEVKEDKPEEVSLPIVDELDSKFSDKEEKHSVVSETKQEISPKVGKKRQSCSETLTPADAEGDKKPDGSSEASAKVPAAIKSENGHSSPSALCLSSPTSESPHSMPDSPKEKRRKDGSKKKKKDKEKDRDSADGKKRKKHHHRDKEKHCLDWGNSMASEMVTPFRLKIKAMPPRPVDLSEGLSATAHVVATTTAPPGYPPLPPGYILTHPLLEDVEAKKESLASAVSSAVSCGISTSTSLGGNHDNQEGVAGAATSRAISVRRNSDPGSDQFCICDVCKELGGVTNAVACDECRKAYHFNCLEPPLKKTPKKRGYSWYCEDCEPAPKKVP